MLVCSLIIMRFADCRKLKIFHSPLKDLNALHNPPARLRRANRAPGLFLCPTAHARGCFGVGTLAELLFSRAGRKPAAAPGTPAVGNSRTRRPGAGLSATAGSSPALLPVMRRLPAKRFALSASSPRLARPRTCGGQVAHPVFFFSASRTHAVGSGCAPALSSCFPRQRKAPAHPPRTETLEKLSSAPWLFKRFPASRRFAAERPRKPASSAEEGKNGRRAQEWGSKGRSPFANLCLLSFRKKVEARRGLSDK